MTDHDNERLLALLTIFVVMAAVLARRRWQPSRTAFGTACWASEKCLRRAGMFGRHGLILGRTLAGRLIRLPEYCHILVVGSTGSGKGISVILPQLLPQGRASYRGSVICFDTKGDLFSIAGARRSEMGQRIIRLAPFNGGYGCVESSGLHPCR